MLIENNWVWKKYLTTKKQQKFGGEVQSWKIHCIVVIWRRKAQDSFVLTTQSSYQYFGVLESDFLFISLQPFKG